MRKCCAYMGDVRGRSALSGQCGATNSILKNREPPCILAPSLAAGIPAQHHLSGPCKQTRLHCNKLEAKNLPNSRIIKPGLWEMLLWEFQSVHQPNSRLYQTCLTQTWCTESVWGCIECHYECCNCSRTQLEIDYLYIGISYKCSPATLWPETLALYTQTLVIPVCQWGFLLLYKVWFLVTKRHRLWKLYWFYCLYGQKNISQRKVTHSRSPTPVEGWFAGKRKSFMDLAEKATTSFNCNHLFWCLQF